jgi:hypothetical protein
VPIFGQFHDIPNTFIIQPVFVQHTLKIIFAKVLEWASMMITSGWRIAGNYSHTARYFVLKCEFLRRKNLPIRSIVCTFPFLSIIMPDVVRVILLELIVRNTSKTAAPKYQRLLQRKAYSFKKQPKLHTTLVLQMLISAKHFMQVTHAWREIGRQLKAIIMILVQ